MNILLIGAEFANKGAEAMTLTVIAELSSRLKNAQFYFRRGAVGGTEDEFLRRGIHAMDNPSYTLLLRRIIAKAHRVPALLTGISDRGHRWLVPELLSLDGVLDVSGYAYGDTPWGRARSQEVAAYCTFARILGVPCIFLPQAFGPFREDDDWLFYRQALRTATLVFARDQESHNEVIRILRGTRQDQVRRCVDMAFSFCGTAESDARQLLFRHAIPSRRLMVLVPNMRVYERTSGHGLDNVYVASLIAAVELAASHALDVLLLPHETRPEKGDVRDDRILVEMVRGAVANAGVHTIPKTLSAAELKGIIGLATVVVASRYHALIAALSQAVPACAIAWSHKYRELFAHFQLQDMVLEAELCSPAAIQKRLARAIIHHDDIALQLTHGLPSCRDQVETMFDQVAETLCESQVPRRYDNPGGRA